MMREATIKRIIEIMHRNGDPDRDPGRFGREVHGRVLHARQFLQRALHARHAGRTGHSADADVQRCRGRFFVHGVSEGLQFRQRKRSHRGKVKRDYWIGFLVLRFVLPTIELFKQLYEAKQP